MSLNRRRFMIGAGLMAVARAPAFAQNPPVRIGLLTVKTGPLATGGILMEQGIRTFLKSRNNTLAGRKVELVVGDTAGNPAGAKTKVQELVERDKVDLIMGPIAAFELLAINDYIVQAKMPILSIAAADDMSQRKPNPWFIRTTASSSQVCHVMGHYLAKERGMKRVGVIADDFAYGYEQLGGFNKVFEDEGGRVVKKLYSPLATADYVPYIAQLTGVDGVFTGIGGGTVRFIRQYADLEGAKKIPLFGGQTTIDDSLLKNLGDEAIGVVTGTSYTASIDTPTNRRFVEEFRRDYNNVPGSYSAGLYMNGMVVEAALARTGGRVDNREEFVKAMRAVSLTDSPRGPLKFDHFGNAVGNVHVVRCERKGAELVNTIIKVYENVDQFWTYGEKAFLAQPVYSRNFPPSRFLE